MTKMPRILNTINTEVVRAQAIHDPMHSNHEAHSVILEEFEEYWAEVKADNREKARVELIQTAAMCVRALYDLY